MQASVGSGAGTGPVRRDCELCAVNTGKVMCEHGEILCWWMCKGHTPGHFISPAGEGEDPGCPTLPEKLSEGPFTFFALLKSL